MLVGPFPPLPETTASGLGQVLLELYEGFLRRYGPQHWWPAQEPFEVMLGAILTQSAAWRNVEKAIANLKGAGALSAAALRELPLEELARIIRPSGYFNAKALKLKALAQRLGERYADDLGQLFSLESAILRAELLGIFGIGEETADSIALYAAQKPLFVIDAYTRRLMYRLGLSSLRASYGELQALFMEHLPHDVALFNEFHALIVRHGKETCQKVPRCQACCLRERCPYPGRGGITG